MNLIIVTKNQLTFSLNVHCQTILNQVSRLEILAHSLDSNFHVKVSSNPNCITIQAIPSPFIQEFDLKLSIKSLDCKAN